MKKIYRITETREPKNKAEIQSPIYKVTAKSSKEALLIVFRPLLKGQKLTLTIEEISESTI